MILPAPDASDLERLCDLPTKPALREAVPFLVRLVGGSAFLENEILPRCEEAKHAGAWYVAHRYGAPDGSCSPQIFVWSPGTGTQIHDHSC